MSTVKPAEGDNNDVVKLLFFFFCDNCIVISITTGTDSFTTVGQVGTEGALLYC